jgi:hypothetical protein
MVGRLGFIQRAGFLGVTRPTQEFFVREGTLHLGGIQESAAEFDGAMHGGDGFGFVCRAVGLTIPMQPKPMADTSSPWLPSLRVVNAINVPNQCCTKTLRASGAGVVPSRGGAEEP